MRAEVFICERCRKMSESGDGFAEVTVKHDTTTTGHDLCSKCYGKLAAWIVGDKARL